MNSLSEPDDGLEGIETERENQLLDPTATTVAVVGLGYVGLPLAVGFDDTGFDVVGYDVSQETIAALEAGTDTTGDLGDEAIVESEVSFTTSPDAISRAEYVVVTVPTPVDDDDRPSMEYVVAAGEEVGQHMTRETTVVLESTVYPGATRQEFAPAIERGSGMTCGEDFFVGYSPERANPGDEEHGLSNVIKVVSGQDETVREDVAALYDLLVDAGVHRAPSMEVAESAKVIENVQRDLNIALVNELATVFEELDVDTRAVLEAAGTKWNFHEYEPGLVGGHCIPVDPHFLAYRARQAGAEPELIQTARAVNESMPHHVADLMVKALSEAGHPLGESRVLVLGLSYKPNVGDLRSSKVADVIAALKEYGIDVVGHDPYADDEAIEAQFDVEAQPTLSLEGFDGLLLATPHEEFRDVDPRVLADRLDDDPAIVDVDGTVDRSLLPESVSYRRV